MTDLFLKTLNLSISASYLVAAVVMIRLLLKKAPKWVWPVLWGLVALRLVCPISIESRVSMIPDPEPVSREAIVAYAPTIRLETPVDRQVNTVNAAQGNPVEVETELGPDDYLAMVWLAGACLMVLYTGISYVNLRRRVGRARRLEKNIFESKNVDSPFVLGLFRPRIYLPEGLTEDDRFYILAHEQAHIRRRDHIWKPLGFALLALHWFNPVIWLAYILLCRDIELACDEKVIKQLGREGRADYSQALLSCAIRHRSIAACPLAFGEVGVKQRVKSVLSYKKPAFWVVLIAVIASVVVAVCFLTNPKQAEKGRMNLDTVMELAEKGNNITWEDLEGYEFEQNYGQPLSIYSMEENFELWVYEAEGTPRVFELHCKAAEVGCAHVDITDRANLDTYLALHNRPLDEGFDDHMTIALDLASITPTGTHLYVYGRGDLEGLEIACEDDYTIRKQDWRGQWVELPRSTPRQTHTVHDPSKLDKTQIYEQTIDWTERYGVLPDGEYLLTKDNIYYDHAGVSIGSFVEATFTVRTEGKPQLTVEEFLKRKKFDNGHAWDWDDKEAYNAKYRNSWADYENFAYVEVIVDYIPQNLHRYYELDNGMIMSMNGDDEHERPNNIQLTNDIPSERMLVDWVNDKEALTYALDLLSQPLAPGQEDHIGLRLALDSYSPTGATVSLVGTPPEHVDVQKYDDYYLEKLNDLGIWEGVPDSNGETHTRSGGPTQIPATQTLNWTEKYGVLPEGTYRINFSTDVRYQNGEEQSTLGMLNYNLYADFVIGASQGAALAAQAQPFDPSEVHDLTQVVTCMGDAEYVINKQEDLSYLEGLLANAKAEKGLPGCPFSSTTYLVRADGAVFSFQHAEDSCEALVAGDTCYSYDYGLGQDFWAVHGIGQSYAQFTYDEQGRAIRKESYEWGRRVPGSTVEYGYDEAGNLTREEHLNEDGTTDWKRLFAYDDRGNQTAWWSYVGEKGGKEVWNRGEREFDDDNKLLKETSYRNDVLYRETAYAYDENGRILEEITSQEGAHVSTARYEWQDDHHYRVYNYTPDGDLVKSTAFVTDDQGRMIRQEFFTKYGTSEGFQEYEYIEGNDDQMIVRYYDKDGNLTEEGWSNID